VFGVLVVVDEFVLGDGDELGVKVVFIVVEFIELFDGCYLCFGGDVVC